MQTSDHRQVRLVLANGGLPLGGSTTFLINLGAELMRRGVAVLVTSFEGANPLADDFRRQQIPMHVEDDRRWIFEDRLISTLEVIRQFGPTCVVACLGPASFELQRYLPPGIFRLGMIQSDYPEIYPPVSLYANYLDGIVAVSKSIKRNLNQHPVLKRLPAHYLPYGVPMPSNFARPIRSPGEPLRIVYLGRLDRPQKRVHLFPSILSQLAASGEPFIWTIAGDGPERAVLERSMPSPAAHQQVEFLGPVAYDQVPALLADQDVFLLISEAEGLPVSLLEAMARGLVPVISDLPSGVPELVDDRTGRKIAIDDLSGYGQAILHLHRDRAELHRLSANAMQRVRDEFSAARMADRWLEVLGENAQETVPPWPRKFQPTAPLESPRPFLFSPPARLIRRGLRTMHAALAAGVLRRSSPR